MGHATDTYFSCDQLQLVRLFVWFSVLLFLLSLLLGEFLLCLLLMFKKKNEMLHGMKCSSHWPYNEGFTQWQINTHTHINIYIYKHARIDSKKDNIEWYSVALQDASESKEFSNITRIRQRASISRCNVGDNIRISRALQLQVFIRMRADGNAWHTCVLSMFVCVPFTALPLLRLSRMCALTYILRRWRWRLPHTHTHTHVQQFICVFVDSLYAHMSIEKCSKPRVDLLKGKANISCTSKRSLSFCLFIGFSLAHFGLPQP